MKKALSAAMILSFLGPLVVFAGPETSLESFSLAVSGGASYPLGSRFQDTYFSGLNGGLTIGYRFSPAICAVLDIGYRRHGLDHGLFSSYYSVKGGDLGVFSIVPGAKIYIPSRERFQVYLLAEAGLFLTTVGELTVSAPGFQGVTCPKETESRFGYVLGAGVEYFLMKKIGLWGDFRFTDVFPKSKDGEEKIHLRDYSFRLGARLLF